jgi:hypothetical protein
MYIYIRTYETNFLSKYTLVNESDAGIWVYVSSLFFIIIINIFVSLYFFLFIYYKYFIAF